MYPRPFEYVAPASLDEALAVLDQTDGAKVLSGGMSLLGLMKLRLVAPGTLVDIGRIPGLDQVEDRGDHVAIGALVRHGTTASHPLTTEHATALAQAASWTGDVQVRNRGTTVWVAGPRRHRRRPARRRHRLRCHDGGAVFGGRA